MKVINVITDTNIGGAGRILLTYIDNYNKNDIDLTIYIPKNSKLKEELIKRNTNFKEVDNIADTSLSFKGIKSLYKLFKVDKPDIVHCHAAMSGRIAAKLYGHCQIIYTRHSVFDIPSNYKKFPRKQMYKFLNNFFATKIVAVSPAAKENALDTGASEDKIQIIFNGVDQVPAINDDEKIQVKNKYDIDSNKKVVSIVARLEEVKGHKYVLEVAKQLPNVEFIIAGTGTLEEKIRHSVLEENLSNVHVLGFVSEIDKILNITDIQLNCSFGTEATSLSLLEGMSLGVPAIVSDYGGNPYVIHNDVNGFVYENHNVEELKQYLDKLLQDEDLYKKLSVGSVDDYYKRFTSQIMTDNITNLYLDLKGE